jgi:hypothetical protein
MDGYSIAQFLGMQSSPLSEREKQEYLEGRVSAMKRMQKTAIFSLGVTFVIVVLIVLVSVLRGLC